MKQHAATFRWACLAVVTLLLVMLVASTLPILNQRDAMITPLSFQQIRTGMLRKELHALLGPPVLQHIVVGNVIDDQHVAINSSSDVTSLRHQGYTDYVMDTWYSPTITITAIVDTNDQVVCRYSSAGQTQTLVGQLWPRRNVSLASPRDSIPTPAAP